MKKLIFVFIIMSFSMFGIDYELDFKKARNLSWEKNYKEAEQIYVELLKEYDSDEIAIAYANMLGWQKKYTQAIDVLEKYVLEGNEKEIQLAKIYLWMGEKELAYKTYFKLKENGNEIGEVAQKFIEKYLKDNQFPVFELEYIYSSDFDVDLKEEKPQIYFTYKKDKDFTLVLSKTWMMKEEEKIVNGLKEIKSKLFRTTSQVEIYIKNHYIYFGNSTIENFFIGDEITWKRFTAGLSYYNYNNSYRVSEINQIGIPLKKLKLTLTQRIAFDYGNGEDSGEINTSYRSEIKYKELIYYRQYYNFEDSNYGELKIKLESKVRFIGQLGLYRDYYRNRNGYIFGVGVKF